MIGSVFGAFLAALGFALLYQVPLGQAWVSGVVGAAAWWATSQLGPDGARGLLGNFVAALTVGVLGEVAARWRRAPASLFMVPGIIAFVPGFEAYRAMVAVLQNQLVSGIELAVRALMSAAALGLGLAVATAVLRPVLSSWVGGGSAVSKPSGDGGD